MAIANSVKAQRILDIQNGKYGFVDQSKGKVKLIDWMKQQHDEYYEKHGASSSYCYSINSATNYLIKYAGENVTLQDIDVAFIRGFIKYLNKVDGCHGGKLGDQTIYTYYIVFIIALNKAVKYDIIPFNPADKIPAEDKPRRTSKTREYLTLEEVQKLIDTECKDGRVKRLFLFCCFTGLRHSDAFLLRWKNIVTLDDGSKQIQTVQKKTKETIYIPLTENALSFLPERYMDGEENRIFQMPETSCAYDYLHDWAKKAGITKNVTFHVARYTYATLLLYYGADIYTVSKLLGHTSVKTTQIYAKVMDETKRKAVELIPDVSLEKK